MSIKAAYFIRIFRTPACWCEDKLFTTRIHFFTRTRQLFTERSSTHQQDGGSHFFVSSMGCLTGITQNVLMGRTSPHSRGLDSEFLHTSTSGHYKTLDGGGSLHSLIIPRRLPAVPVSSTDSGHRGNPKKLWQKWTIRENLVYRLFCHIPLYTYDLSESTSKERRKVLRRIFAYIVPCPLQSPEKSS